MRPIRRIAPEDATENNAAMGRKCTPQRAYARACILSPFFCILRARNTHHLEHFMKSNVGTIDKVVRLVIGVALLAVLVFADGWGRYLGLIGIIPIVTALVGYCPLYSVCGASTCRIPDKS
jgi:hypothetical protein